MRIGIFGVGRGMDLARCFMLLDEEIVAICDNHKERRDEALKGLDKSVAVYESFDEFINHPMDVVVLANNFHQHAAYAIKCFERNLHVLCECISNATMGEGVELLRAFEKSRSIYMLSENYPQMLFNREMKRVADAGMLGKILYAEGEYNHPGNPWDASSKKRYNYYPKHWRNFLPRTYYITHSLGPIMNISRATPKKVSAFGIFCPPEGDIPFASYNGDKAANITTLNDDGSVFRLTGHAAFAGPYNSYRICGSKGQIENARGLDDEVLLRFNDWTVPEGYKQRQHYKPSWNDKDEELLVKTGHGGSDYLTVRMFRDAVLAREQPPFPFDIYSATLMSSVAILAHRSVLDGGKVYDIPDFRREDDRRLYENDYLSPFWSEDGIPPTVPCCSHPDFKPTEKQVELYLEALKK